MEDVAIRRNYKTFSGGTPKSNNAGYYNGDIPFIRSGEISKQFTELKITENALNNSSAKLVEKGDLLYAPMELQVER